MPDQLWRGLSIAVDALGVVGASGGPVVESLDGWEKIMKKLVVSYVQFLPESTQYRFTNGFSPWNQKLVTGARRSLTISREACRGHTRHCRKVSVQCQCYLLSNS